MLASWLAHNRGAMIPALQCHTGVTREALELFAVGVSVLQWRLGYDVLLV